MSRIHDRTIKYIDECLDIHDRLFLSNDGNVRKPYSERSMVPNLFWIVGMVGIMDVSFFYSNLLLYFVCYIIMVKNIVCICDKLIKRTNLSITWVTLATLGMVICSAYLLYIAHDLLPVELLHTGDPAEFGIDLGISCLVFLAMLSD